MQNQTAPAQSAVTSKPAPLVRWVAGVECVRIGDPARVEYFGDAAHVPVSYRVMSDRGPRFVAGWLPFPIWEAAPRAK